MKANFGHFEIDVDGRKMFVSPLITGLPISNNTIPDRRAFMVFVANTFVGLMRMAEPVLVADHENVTEGEIAKMLGSYGDLPRTEVSYKDFLKG